MLYKKLFSLLLLTIFFQNYTVSNRIGKEYEIGAVETTYKNSPIIITFYQLESTRKLIMIAQGDHCQGDFHTDYSKSSLFVLDQVNGIQETSNGLKINSNLGSHHIVLEHNGISSL